MSSVQEHRKKAAEKGPVSLALITVSDTRTEATDENGKYLKAEIQSAGNKVILYSLVKDEPSDLTKMFDTALQSQAQVIIFNGGTGIAPRDNTYDIVSKKLEKVLPGFGEIFRMLSFKQVGSAAILSRATAGTCRGKIIICIPGSPQAVKLAWSEIIKPELQHLAWEVGR